MSDDIIHFDAQGWSPAVAARGPQLQTAADRPAFVGNAGGVIIMGGDCGALGVCRSLGGLRIPIEVLPGPNPISRFSRYANTGPGWPGAESPDALAWLESRARAGGAGGWVLIPAGDSEVRLVTNNYQRLSALYRLATPPWEVTRFAGDKTLTYALAAELEIGHPRTYRVSTMEEAEAAQLAYPLILKPAMKEGVNALTIDKAWRADDRAEFLVMFEEGLRLAGAGGLIVQELIPDDGQNQFSYCAFCENGEPRLVMTARRVRQKPRKAGTGTYVETLGPQPYERDAEVFLKALGYTGLVEIEFMRDPRDGSFRLIDVNPRVWTWNALGLPAGVDFPLAVWNHANGLAVPSGRAAAGHSWIYVSRDVISALEDMRDGHLSFPDYLRQLFGASSYATFDTRDLLPALADLPVGLWRRLRR